MITTRGPKPRGTKPVNPATQTALAPALSINREAMGENVFNRWYSLSAWERGEFVRQAVEDMQLQAELVATLRPIAALWQERFYGLPDGDTVYNTSLTVRELKAVKAVLGKVDNL